MVAAQLPLEVVGVLVLEAVQLRAPERSELCALVDRLVRPPVDEHGAAGSQDRDHRKVNERDRRQDEHILGAE